MGSHRLYHGLERRFDGEIPDHLRRIALAGGTSALLAAAARANSRCCDRLALAAVRNAATERSPAAELDHWRTQGLAWHARLAIA
jgi:hypothetical protein